MKITPLILFLILLFVLSISVLFSKYLPLFSNRQSEGFISFEETKNILDPVYIPQYSTNSNDMLVKIYDNIFFDSANGNLIEVDGTVYMDGNTNTDGNLIINGNVDVNAIDTGNIDIDGTSINQIYVLQRTNTSAVVYPSIYDDENTLIPFKTPESAIPNVTNSFLQKVYTTQCVDTDTYQIVYIGWGLRTYLHVMNLTNNTNIGSFVFGKDTFGQNIAFNPQYMIYGKNTLIGGTNTDDSDSKNSTYVKLPDYDATAELYQVNKSTFFDKRNGNLIVRIGNSNSIYDRSGALLPTGAPLTTTLKSVSFNSWITPDANNNMVLYMPESDKTVIAIIKQNTNDSYFNVGNVARFTKDGLETSSISEPAGLHNPDGSAAPTSEYYKWLAYWNTTINPRQETSDDYILKTQIVPPVCPSCSTCPSCPASGTCTNCGGHGGSGTIVQNAQRGVSGVINNTLNTTGDIIKDTANAGADIINNTGNNATALLTGAGSGAANLLTGAGSGATNLLTGAGSGAVGLLTSAGSGAVGLLKSTGSGISSILTPAGQMQSMDTSPIYGQNQLMGPSISYGQNQSIPENKVTQGQNTQVHSNDVAVSNNKSSPFMPITADFSAFGK